MEIGEPVLISRTDEGRRCIPLSRPNSPTPSLPASDLSHVSTTTSRVADQHPSGVNPHEDVIESHLARARAQSIERCYDGLTRNKSCSRSREPSPLRNAIVNDESSSRQPVLIPDDITEEIEDEDDFNFEHNAANEIDQDTEFVTGLSAPPSRRRSIVNLAVASASHLVAVSPEAVQPNTQEVAPSVSEQTVIKTPSPIDTSFASHFSISTTNTTALSPGSDQATSPDSPCLSPASNSSLPAHLAYRFSAQSTVPSVSDSDLDPVEYNKWQMADDGVEISTSPTYQDENFASAFSYEDKPKREESYFGLASESQGYSLPGEHRLPAKGTAKPSSNSGLTASGCRMTFGGPLVRDEQRANDEAQCQSKVANGDIISDMGYLAGIITHT